MASLYSYPSKISSTFCFYMFIMPTPLSESYLTSRSAYPNVFLKIHLPVCPRDISFSNCKLKSTCTQKTTKTHLLSLQNPGMKFSVKSEEVKALIMKKQGQRDWITCSVPQRVMYRKWDSNTKVSALFIMLLGWLSELILLLLRYMSHICFHVFLPS